MEATRAPPARVTEVAPRTPTDAQLNLQIAQMQIQQRELMEQILNMQKTIQAMQTTAGKGTDHDPSHGPQAEEKTELAGTTLHSVKQQRNVYHFALHRNRKTH